jgi:NitT/TauT family transport system permease protein
MSLANAARVRAVALPVLLGVALLIGWHWAVTAMRISPIMLPKPQAVFNVVYQNAALLRQHATHTLLEILVAIVLSSVVGILLGFLLSTSQRVRAALMPNLVLFELIPKIALAPLFIIWLGTGTESRLAFAFFLSFFPVLIAATTGLITTDPSLVRLCRSLRATWWQTLTQVRLPYAVPLLFSGIKIGATMAVIGIIVGEFITGNRGLGYIIMFAASNMETSLMLGAMVLLCILGTAVYGAIVLLEILAGRRYGRPSTT